MLLTAKPDRILMQGMLLSHFTTHVLAKGFEFRVVFLRPVGLPRLKVKNLVYVAILPIACEGEEMDSCLPQGH